MSEWISVKDGLPDNGDVVDIWARHNSQTQMNTELLNSIGINDGTTLNGWRVTDVKYYTDDYGEGELHLFSKDAPLRRPIEFCVEEGTVTHWRRRPKPPTTENSDDG